jgi:hypothetical protein
MKQLPPELQARVDTLKNYVLINLGLNQQIDRNDISLELINIDFDWKEGKKRVYEIVFDLTIKNVDCDSCDFEPDAISDNLKQYFNVVLEICQVGLSADLKLNKKTNSFRGIMIHEVNLSHSEFSEISLGLFWDPEEAYGDYSNY